MHSFDAVFMRFIPALVLCTLLSNDAAAEETAEWRLGLEAGTVLSRTTTGDVADAAVSPGALLPAPLGTVTGSVELPPAGLIGLSFELGLTGGGFRTIETWRLVLAVPFSVVTRFHFDDAFTLKVIAGLKFPFWYQDEPLQPLPVPAVGLGADLWDTGTYRWFVDFEWVPVALPFATFGEENGSYVEFYLFTLGVSR